MKINTITQQSQVKPQSCAGKGAKKGAKIGVAAGVGAVATAFVTCGKDLCKISSDLKDKKSGLKTAAGMTTALFAITTGVCALIGGIIGKFADIKNEKANELQKSLANSSISTEFEDEHAEVAD